MKSRWVDRPTYLSRNKVVAAVRNSPNQELRRWELLEQTGLDPHTLSATCRFLVSKKCLTRSVLKGYKGRSHRVSYGMARNPHLDVEIDRLLTRPEERRKDWAKFSRLMRDLRNSHGRYETFCRKHEGLITSIRDTYRVDPKDMPIVASTALIRLASIYGVKEMMARVLDLNKLNPDEQYAYMLFLYDGRNPNLEEARAHAAHYKRKHGHDLLTVDVTA